MSDVFATALRLLTRREHGAKELTNKLLQKGYADKAVHDALMECQRLDWQSDERFVDMICRARIRQGYGPVRIRLELQQFQVDPGLIEAALQLEQDNWLGYAMNVWKKKFKTHDKLSFVEQQKQKKFLLYRGFTLDIIEKVVVP